MNTLIIIGLIVLFIAAFVGLIVWTMKTSKKFWATATKIEAEIDKATTCEELQRIFETTFSELTKYSGGEPQTSKVNYIYGTLNGKYQGIKQLNDAKENS